MLLKKQVNSIFSFIFIVCCILDAHPVVSEIDIEKFMGRWYVIALIPNWIEEGATNAYDDYSLNDDGTIDITYFAIKDGKEKGVKQKGYVNKDESARWKVQFMKPYIPFFTAPYEVIILDADYEYMVVGYPDNSYGWIMSRVTSMSSDLYNSVLNRLEVDFGYDKDAFEKVYHGS